MVAQLELPYRETIPNGEMCEMWVDLEQFQLCQCLPNHPACFLKQNENFILERFQNLCGFQVGVAANSQSREGEKKKGEDEKESCLVGHVGHSPDAHHHLSHAPWQEGRPGARQGGFLWVQGRDEQDS